MHLRVLVALAAPIFLPEFGLLLRYSRVFPFFGARVLWLLLPVLGLLASCATTKYSRQRTMFQLTEGADGKVDTARLRRAVNRTSRNYRIKPNDFLSVRVYTNKGEALIDPNNYLQFSSTGGAAATGGSSRPASASGGARSIGTGAGGNSTDYLVQADGRVRLPLVGEVSLTGLTLLQADSVLTIQYDTYYKQSFVRTTVTNNRVIVLGASGGQVIPLNNDNMNLLEVLALAGGIDATTAGVGARYGGRVDNIRIIRGDLKNPQVQFIDLSTLEGMRRGNLQVEPNDVIYIQPVRRPFLEGLTDAAPAIGVFGSVLGTVLGTVSVIITIIAFNRTRTGG